jgi:hypothetical protein
MEVNKKKLMFFGSSLKEYENRMKVVDYEKYSKYVRFSLFLNLTCLIMGLCILATNSSSKQWLYTLFLLANFNTYFYGYRIIFNRSFIVTNKNIIFEPAAAMIFLDAFLIFFNWIFVSYSFVKIHQETQQIGAIIVVVALFFCLYLSYHFFRSRLI